MDDFYQFMSPLEGATNNANDRPSTQPLAAQTGNAQSSSSTSSTSSRTSWSAWGVSFNKLIERGKKDMNEFVDVTRKDLSELVHTVQQEHSTTIESLSKKVGDLKTNLPPLPASVNTASAGILERVSTVVGGITHEIKEVATGVSSNPQTVAPDNTTEANVSTASVTGSTDSPSSKQNANSHGATASPNEKTVEEGSLTDTRDTMDSTASRIKPDEKPNFSLANTASLLSAGATSLTQTLSSSTKDISSSANELFKKKLPAAAEKHLGEADLFFKNTTETLKTNGLLAEQYVNKFGAGMANFLNSAVVISAPGAKEATPSRSKKMFFDRKEAMLEKLRMDPTTFTVDPMTTIADDDIIGLERYKRFLQTFNMAEYQQRTSRLLNEYPELKALMGKLVPAEVADEELFWLRYYYRLYEIEEEEKRLKKLVQEAGADLAEEDFTWDDNDGDEDDSENQGESGGQGSVTPKAEQKNQDTLTPTASQILNGSQPTDSSNMKQEPLTAEALVVSLSALPIPSNQADSEDGDKTKSRPDVTSTSTHSKGPVTNLSSTRTSEDTYEVVDGVETPIRAPLASVASLSTASSPALEQLAHQQSTKQKSPESKDEDDWSDWE